MEHLAIMRKTWGLTKKILDGRKKIESRWYSVKYRPWDNIKKGDTIYFKDSGSLVHFKVPVDQVLQFSDLTPQKVRNILKKYGDDDGIEKHEIPEFFERFKDKKYCILIFLGKPVGIKPFNISKVGYGAMSAWITAKSIKKLRSPQNKNPAKQ